MKPIKNLVLSGGGLRGYSYLGLIKSIEENPKSYHIKKIAASSVGSFFAILIAMCVSYNEIYQRAADKDIHDLQHIKLDNILKFQERFGIDDGHMFIDFLAYFVGTKLGNTEITMKEVYDKTGVELYISGTCLNTKDVIYFSHHNYPNMPLLLAVRISISIPFYFIPIYYENKLFVDGGVVDNFPIQLFEDEMEDTLGIYLMDNKEMGESVESLEDYAYKLYVCNNGSKIINKIKKYEPYCLNIPLNSIEIYSKSVAPEARREWETIVHNTLDLYLKKRQLYPPIPFKEYVQNKELEKHKMEMEGLVAKIKREIYEEVSEKIHDVLTDIFDKKLTELLKDKNE